MQVIPLVRASVHRLAFSPDGWMLYGAGNSPAIRVWNLHDSQLLGGYYPSEPNSLVHTFALSPDGWHVVGRYTRGNTVLVVWDITSPEEFVSFPFMFESIHFSPDGEIFGGLLDDSYETEQRNDRFGLCDFYRVWSYEHLEAPPAVDSTQQAEHPVLLREVEKITEFAGFGTDGRVLIIVNDFFAWYDLANRTPCEWFEIRKAKEVATRTYGRRVFSADCTRMARWGYTNRAKVMNVDLWDTTTGSLLDRIDAAGLPYSSHHSTLAFSPDGQKLAMACLTSVCIRDLRTGEVTGPFDWNIGRISCLAFAPDALRLAVAGQSAIAIVDVE